MRTFHDTLLASLVEQFMPALAAALPPGPDIAWERDGLRFTARNPASRRHLGAITIKPAWPDRGYFAATRNMGLDFAAAPHCPDHLRPVLEAHVRRLFQMLNLLEDRLEHWLSVVFPRRPDGNIDWSRTPAPSSPPPPASGHAPSGSVFTVGDTGCDAACIFCPRALCPGPDAPALLARHETLYRALKHLWPPAATSRLRPLIVNGDEPLRHPDLPSLIELAASRGFSPVRLHTNAPARLTAEVADRLARAGLNDIHLALYGVTAATHDAIVGRPGHLDALHTALAVCAARPLRVSLHSVCLAQNLHELPLMPQWARDHHSDVVQYHLVRDTGESPLPYADLLPPLARLPLGVRSRLDLTIPCLDIHPPVNLDVSHMPDQELAYLGEAQGATGSASLDTEWPDTCAVCRDRRRCTGVFRGYLAVHGAGEFRPRR